MHELINFKFKCGVGDTTNYICTLYSCNNNNNNNNNNNITLKMTPVAAETC